MSIKFLQLNIFMGKYIDRVVEYVKKEDFDILCFQEVSGGRVSFNRENLFKTFIDLGYDGELGVTWRVKDDHTSFFGNATFFKHDFTLLEKTEVWLKEYQTIIDPDTRDTRNDPKASLSLLLEKDGIKLHVVNAHLAWTPDAEDSDEKIRQAKIFRDYLTTITKPYIIAGDFNVEKHTSVISLIDSIGGQNLTKEYNVTNTLNPHVHKARHLFPKGLAVDYVYVSEDISVQTFEVLQEDLSDHLGLATTLEVK